MLLYAIVAILSIAAASACSFDVQAVHAKLIGKPFDSAILSNTSYTPQEVEESFAGLGTYGKPRWVLNTKASFKCVDSRGDEKQNGLLSLAGTPGGDFAELAAGIVAYHRVQNTTVTEESVKKIFLQFMSKIATPTRPFYFHSSDGKLAHAFDDVLILVKAHNEEHNTSFPEHLPVAMPERAPKEPEHADIWYEALSENPLAQGCGHIRLIMSNAKDYGYSGAETHATSWLIKSFFQYWWVTKPGSLQRAKTLFPILPGDLLGRSMSIINNTGPECLDATPTFIPHHAASTQFVYAAQAVNDFRAKVLVPFFVQYDKTTNAEALLKAVTELQDLHLAATLRLLVPVNTVPVIAVDIETTTAAQPGRKMHLKA